ncbi:MAG: hypothetical protein K2O12_07195, partial [Muribaculaceae bacterium]|nr:hypothetical protein [Muribaculaceae bacterium]
MITADFDRTPEQYTAGKTTYSIPLLNTTEYITRNSNRINSFIYNGYIYLTLPHSNSITFNPYYAYTHTGQSSSYHETGFNMIENEAIDDSHQASGDLSFVHSFGKAGTLKIMYQGRLLHNRTHYYGTSSTSDQARTYRLGPGINYSFSNDKLYGSIVLGLYWDKSVYGDITETSTAPRTDISLQYAFNRKNSISTAFRYGKSIPSSSYRSASVVQSDPLISYTGNPGLVPYNSFQIEGNYTFIPDNRYSMSAFGWAWIVDNRYVFDYEATPNGILRTIKQPMGSYAQWQYGLQVSSKLLDNNLQLGGTMYLEHAHNGAPYNWNKSKCIASVSAYYYLNRLYFGATYDTPSGYADGCMTGIWTSPRSSYTFQVGWSDHHWNLRFYTRNFLRYHTYQTKATMHSMYYDSTRYLYSSSYAGFFQISATYNFSFGKKIKAGNEAYQASGASSGILK